MDDNDDDYDKAGLNPSCINDMPAESEEEGVKGDVESDETSPSEDLYTKALPTGNSQKALKRINEIVQEADNGEDTEEGESPASSEESGKHPIQKPSSDTERTNEDLDNEIIIIVNKLAEEKERIKNKLKHMHDGDP